MSDIERLRAINPALVVECGHNVYSCEGGPSRCHTWEDDHIADCPGPQSNLSALVAIAETAFTRIFLCDYCDAREQLDDALAAALESKGDKIQRLLAAEGDSNDYWD